MRICLVGAELFHADGQKDKYDEAKQSLFKILWRRLGRARMKKLKADKFREMLANIPLRNDIAVGIEATDMSTKLQVVSPPANQK